MAVQGGSDFGAELRRSRLKAGLSQTELARMLHFSKSYLNKIESGAKPPTLDLARRCERALGIDGTLVDLYEAAANAPSVSFTDEVPARSTIVIPRQVPAKPRYLIGREADLMTLTALADAAQGERTQFIVITGPAGIGKTALAVNWAHSMADRFPDGSLYVNLRGFGPAIRPVTPSDALIGFLDALGVPPEQIPATLDARSALYRSLTANRRLLVVLDNARDADHSRPLFPAGDRCVAVVTSRNNLTGLLTDGADAVRPQLLSAVQTEELLAARLGAAPLAEEREEAGALVAFCGGLPLAANIVAARAATRAASGTGPAGTLADHAKAIREARSRLDELSTDDLSTDLRAVFSWSYRLLSPETARMFRLLALHPGLDCSLEAASSLSCRSVGQTRIALEELKSAHLIIEPVPGRYAYHDLVREYAREQSAEIDGPPARSATVRRLLDHYLYTAQAATIGMAPAWVPVAAGPPAHGVRPEAISDAENAKTWFEDEFHVLPSIVRLAADTGNDRHAWQIPVALRTFFDRRGHWREMEQAHRTALDAARQLNDAAAEAAARRGLGRAYLRLRDYTASLTNVGQALSIHEEQGDRLGQAYAHHDLALIAEQQGDYVTALHQAQQALEHFEAAGSEPARANSLNTVGWFYALVGDHAKALEHCTRALRLFQGLGDAAGEAGTWDSVGYAHHSLGNLGEAVAAYQASIERYRQIGDRFYEAGTLVRLGDVQLASGNSGEAGHAWHAALAILEELKHPDAEQVVSKVRNLPKG